MQNKSKSKKIITVIVVIVILIFILWSKGIFYIIDRQTSPNGKITTTVYSRDVSNVLPKDSGFTIKTTGESVGTRIRTDGSEFEKIWWSPDSNYQVISTIYEDKRLLELKNYVNNSVTNLNFYINMNMSSQEEFTKLMPEEKHWNTLQFEFVEWNKEPGSMTVEFEFKDYAKNIQKGNLNFNCETGIVSQIKFQQ